MSLPTFPSKANLPTRDDAINQIISSIAMEELGLSHIINAEGEKLQYALGTIEGVTGPEIPATIKDLLDINNSIHKTLDGTMMSQFMLKDKLASALSASVMQGPKGDVGSILDSYKTIEDLKKEHPTGKQGDTYLVGGELHVWDMETAAWKSVGNMIGPTGPQGLAGPISVILGSEDSYADLVTNHPKGQLGDLWIAGTEVYTWRVDPGEWESVGDFAGPTGPTGKRGAVGTILNSYVTPEALRNAHSKGNQGDAYLVGEGDIYVWKEGATDWVNVGNVRGPEGQEGEKGEKGDRGEHGPAGEQGPEGKAGIGGSILGTSPSETQLIADHPTGEASDMYLVGTAPNFELYFWEPDKSPTPGWTNAGPFTATEGPAGPEGRQGANTQILGTFEDYEKLVAAHSSGTVGESYLVGAGDLYTWIGGTPGQWTHVGNLMGPTGTFDTSGTLFTVNGSDNGIKVAYGDDLKFKSSSLDISVNLATSTVNIEDPSVTDQDKMILFNSVTSIVLTSDGFGQRAPVFTVGNGSSQATSTTKNPATIPGAPLIPIKFFTKGTITELHVALTTTVTGHSDSDLVIYAQLYSAPTLTTTSFFPIQETLIDMGTMRNGAPIGTTMYKELTGLSIPIEPGTQYLLGFDCTAGWAAISRQEVYLGGWMKVEKSV